MMIERIVVGIDRGTLADHAVAMGLELAGTFGAELTFVHGAGGGGKARERAEAACRERLGAFAAHPRLAGEGLSARLVVREETASRALLRHVGPGRAALIVLGAHRHRRVLDFGGTGRAVLARSPCPVWVQPQAPRPLRTLLAPIDLSPDSARVLEAARGLAVEFGAEVHVLNCFRPPLFAYDGEAAEPSATARVIDDARRSERVAFETLVREFPWRGVRVEAVSAVGEPWTVVLARQDGCDLVVMGTHGRTGFSRAVLGSVAHRVLKGTRRPLLVVPLPEPASVVGEPPAD